MTPSNPLQNSCTPTSARPSPYVEICRDDQCQRAAEERHAAVCGRSRECQRRSQTGATVDDEHVPALAVL